MARDVPYSEGVTSVAPSPTPPDDYQRINASPESFGAAIGRGMEQFGEAGTKAVGVYEHAAVDDASNQFQEFTSKLLHGDPSRQTAGPDGKPMPDTGYLGTQGRTALDRRPDVDKALTEQMDTIRKNLPTPESQREFDNFARRYHTSVSERIGSHAEGQSKTWYSSVNTSTAKLAMEHIANNYDNPNEIAAGAADLTAAYVKNAQLQGAGPDSPQMKEAFQAARRDALDSQLNAMAVKDPSRALAVLDKNREIAGIKYDDMAAKFRTRAKQQQGYDIAEQALRKTYEAQPAQPAYQPAALTAAGAPYGISGAYLQRTQQLETGNNPNQESKTGAKGPFQFIDSTAKQYGVKDPYDYVQAADGAARLAAANRDQLAQKLGRAPTEPEIYLAHQQGAGGASLLLRNPTARAGDLLPPRWVNGKLVDPIKVNGGDPDAPASQFTSMWTAKFVGAPGQAYATRKAAAFQGIMADPNLDPEVRQHALQHVEQQMRAAQIAEEQDSKAVKAQREQAQSELVRKIINGTSPSIIGDIANSGLSATEMENLYRFATNEGGIQDDMRYGPGYAAAFRQVLSAPDDPSHISSVGDVIARGGPGGDLTKKGVTELLGVMDKIKKQPDQAGVATVKSKQLDYYLDQFAIDQNSPLAGIPGMKPMRSQKGVDKFNHEFVPAFEAAYSQWVAAGKDPMAFLADNKQMDAIANRVYPLSERAADAIKANPGEQKPPPAPEGVPEGSWQKLVTSPPKLKDGTTVPLDKWGNVLEWLRKNPTPENRAAFDAKMGPSGYTADFVLKRIPPEKAPEQPKAAAPVAPAPQEPVAAEPPRAKGPTYD